MSGNINFNGWINDDGSENYKCRAWVNFNGTGTVAIRAAGNVSSITDGGTGDYTVNFTTAMSDANYASSVSGGATSSTLTSQIAYQSWKTAGSCRVAHYENSSGVDTDSMTVTIFR